MTPLLLTEDEAATMLAVSAGYLEKLRAAGDGPAFVRVGNKSIRYRPADLADYVANLPTGDHTSKAAPVFGRPNARRPRTTERPSNVA